MQRKDIIPKVKYLPLQLYVAGLDGAPNQTRMAKTTVQGGCWQVVELVLSLPLYIYIIVKPLKLSTTISRAASREKYSGYALKS